MSETQTVLAGASPAARYESLIRLADAIRSQQGEGDLFGLLAEELRRVVPFDAIAQFDETATKVNWRSHASHDAVCPLTSAEREESVAWWVHQHQQPFVVPFVDRETRCRPSMERMRTLGLQSMCALPLSTAHRKLGTLVVVEPPARGLRHRRRALSRARGVPDRAGHGRRAQLPRVAARRGAAAPAARSHQPRRLDARSPRPAARGVGQHPAGDALRRRRRLAARSRNGRSAPLCPRLPHRQGRDPGRHERDPHAQRRARVRHRAGDQHDARGDRERRRHQGSSTRGRCAGFHSSAATACSAC